VTGGARDDDRAIAETPVVDPPGTPPDEEPREPFPGAGAARGALRRVGTGDLLGRYELGEELGEGGMATVFRARDRDLRREVAVKVLFPHLARRVEIVRRFHREARAAAALEHPNILRIYDVGGDEPGEPPYIVMELVRGRTLLQEIEQRGALLAEVVACIGALLGDALAAAHAAGVIHRDVKPSNVLIAPGGRLLLADFGVARLETEDSLVTRTGALLGTPAYMSPEQACGDIATAQSDLYSLGATLYQLATGALPYSGSPAKVMSMIAAGNLVAPVRRRAACGQDLSRLIERAMAVDPAARPANAAAMATELRALAASGGFGDPVDELAAYFGDPDGFGGARTPGVVSALVSAARAAIAQARLPRAMALADRAIALAPADPVVAELVRAVTHGGHRARRRRMLAIAGVALAITGGAIATAAQLRGAGSTAAPPDRRELAQVAPAATAAGAGAPAAPSLPATPSPSPAIPSTAAGREAPDRASARGQDVASSGDRVSAALSGTATPPRAAPAVAATPAGSSARARPPARPAPVDAAASPSQAARGADRPAAVQGAARPSTPAPPLPGAPAFTAPSVSRNPGSSGPPAAASEPAFADKPAVPPAATASGSGTGAVAVSGHVIVHNDLWCNISIDGNPYGNRRNEPLAVSAGRHVVRCVNPAGEWTQTVEVTAGAIQTVSGSVLKEFAVTLEIDATIDGRAYARGAVVKLKPGNIEVIVDGKKQFITFRASCRLRNTPALGCYL